MFPDQLISFFITPEFVTGVITGSLVSRTVRRTLKDRIQSFGDGDA